jgi:hypothetical protein
MPHFFLLILFHILIQSGKRGKWNCTIHGKIVMPENTHIHTYIHFYIDRLTGVAREFIFPIFYEAGEGINSLSIVKSKFFYLQVLKIVSTLYKL